MEGDVPEAAEPEAPAGDSPDALREQAAQAQERVLRLTAELENVRRRQRRELDDERRYAAAPLIRDLLPVIDNLTRAIEASAKSPGAEAFVQGVQLSLAQFETVLAQHQCHEIKALHQPFDPNLHQAILQQPSAEFAAGTVVMVTQKGYQLHDRVIRPAQVIVAAAPQ